MKMVIGICIWAFFGLSPVSSAVGALEVFHLESDEALLEILPEENVAFVAEGRIGDLGGAAMFELDLGQSVGAPAVTDQHDWQSGVTEAFSLTYDKTWNRVDFTIGETMLQYTPGQLFMEIFVRAWAEDAGTSISLEDLILNGESVPATCEATGAAGLDILRIRGGTLLDGFVLTGTATMEWSASPPTESGLSFQINAGSPDTQVATAKVTWGQIKNRFR